MKISLFLLLAGLVFSCKNASSPESNPAEPEKINKTIPSNLWVRDDNNAVLDGRGTGISNICDPSVLFAEGKYRMWASCVESDVSYASICYSESSDGISWSEPEIVFSPSSGGWDNQKTEVPSVVYDEGDTLKPYKMWYGGAGTDNGNLTKIGYAWSVDGRNWTRVPAAESPRGKEGLVMIPGFIPGDAGVVSDPSVLLKDGQFEMWFSSWGSQDDLLISRAVSRDGINWVKYTANPVLAPGQNWETAGPGDMTEDVCHPSVVWHESENTYLLWYGSFDDSDNETYSGIGFASSGDGIQWQKGVNNPVFLPDTEKQGEQTGLSTGPSVLWAENVWHLYYSGADHTASRVINHAVSP